MKKLLLAFLLAGAVFAACNNETKSSTETKDTATTKASTAAEEDEPDNMNSQKGNWAQAERAEFVQECVDAVKAQAAASKSKTAIDSSAVVNSCVCVGKKMEDAYSYEEASKLDDAKLKAETLRMLNECKSEGE